jgi:parallel beta-helix repeat protein
MRIIAAFLLSAFAAFAQAADVSQGYASVDDIPETEITNLPFTITAPGFYYLKTNLTLETPGADGIVVKANAVGIDCFGFSIQGPGEGSGHGVVQSPTNHLFVLANTTLSGWRGEGKYAVYAEGGADRMEKVKSIGNSKGIFCGDSSTILSCVVQSNVVEDAGYGIDVDHGSQVMDCEVSNVAGRRDGCGIRVGSNSIVRGCTVRNVTGGGSCYGIYAGKVCNVVNCDVRFCRGGGEPSSGIREMGSSVVMSNVVINSSHHGVWLADVSRAEFNTMEHNGAAGLYIDGPGCRVEGNTLVSNKWGIWTVTTNHHIIGNKAIGNEIAYEGLMVSGNVCGVISKTPTNDPEANLEL